MIEVSSISLFRTGLASMSIADQKRIFDTLPAGIQAAVWHDRLKEGIAAVGDKAQAEVLSGLFGLLSRESYANENENKLAVERIEALAPQIEKVFPDPLSFQKYTQSLGDEPRSDKTIGDLAGGKPTCLCSSARSGNVNGNDCGPLGVCEKGRCKPTKLGCGALWLQTCDGLCA